jgi:hypothetical protein
MKKKKFSLEYWRDEIEKQVKHGGSRTVIVFMLNALEGRYGLLERNNVVKDFSLDKSYNIEIK